MLAYTVHCRVEHVNLCITFTSKVLAVEVFWQETLIQKIHNNEYTPCCYVCYCYYFSFLQSLIYLKLVDMHQMAK